MGQCYYNGHYLFVTYRPLHLAIIHENTNLTQYLVKLIVGVYMNLDIANNMRQVWYNVCVCVCVCYLWRLVWLMSLVHVQCYVHRVTDGSAGFHECTLVGQKNVHLHRNLL